MSEWYSNTHRTHPQGHVHVVVAPGLDERKSIGFRGQVEHLPWVVRVRGKSERATLLVLCIDTRPGQELFHVGRIYVYKVRSLHTVATRTLIGFVLDICLQSACQEWGSLDDNSCKPKPSSGVCSWSCSSIVAHRSTWMMRPVPAMISTEPTSTACSYLVRNLTRAYLRTMRCTSIGQVFRNFSLTPPCSCARSA